MHELYYVFVFTCILFIFLNILLSLGASISSFYLSVIVMCILFFLYLSATTAAAPPANPCVPSPCGPYSQCRVINDSPACSCNANYIGTPPNCRPQCVIQPDCPSNLACKNERCVDPCPGSCGTLSLCQVINHNPVCTCPPGYTGNALVSCQLEPSKILDNICGSTWPKVPLH